MMNSLNINGHSQTSAFKEFKRILYKCHPRFVKAYKNQPNWLDIRKFLGVWMHAKYETCLEHWQAFREC